MNGIPLFEQGEARDALKKRCREAKITIRLLEDLLEAEMDLSGKQQRRRALWDKFEQLLDQNLGASGTEQGEE
jgi:hypothetical protein